MRLQPERGSTGGAWSGVSRLLRSTLILPPPKKTTSKHNTAPRFYHR